MEIEKNLLVVLVVLVLGSDVNLEASDSEAIRYFRSDRGLAKKEQVLPDRLDDSETLVWKQSLPSGHSTPCVTDNYIFLTTFDDELLSTVSLDRKTGRVLWRRNAPVKDVEQYHNAGSPAAASPAFDGQRVFSFFGSYGVLCYDLEGSLLWSRPLGPFQDEFGAASSPILAGGLVILNEDHDVDSFLIALDAETGETVWKVSRDGFTRSYATPLIWPAKSGDQLLVPGALQLAAYDLKEGKKLWWVNGLARIVNPVPAIGEGKLFVATWTQGGDQGSRIAMEPWNQAAIQWDKNLDTKIARDELPEGPVLTRFFRIDLNQDGAIDQKEWESHARVFELADNAVLAIEPHGRGDVTKQSVVWKYDRGVPYVASPLYYRGILYVVKDGGIVTSFQASGGKVLKQARIPGRGEYYSSPVAGDGKICLGDRRGVLTVLKAQGQWEVLHVRDFESPILATPVIEDGQIYVRTEEAIYCFEVKK